MPKMFNTKKIKTRESYLTKGICELLGVHPRTVQAWIKEGLKTINEQKPFLIMGYDLKEFLDEKNTKRKHRLEKNEFYCTKCRHGVRSTDNDVWLEISDYTIGKEGFNALIIKGVCENCGSRLNRFSHTGKLDEIKQAFNVVEE